MQKAQKASRRLSALRLPPLAKMKTGKDPRHHRRRVAARQLFAKTFNPGQPLGELAQKVWQKRGTIDPVITQTAPEWPLEKLNKTDLAILRLAVYELKEEKEPVKVIIDEAVELAKEIGSESSPSFVNGVLGTIVKRGKDEG